MLPKILEWFWEDLFRYHLFGLRRFILCSSAGLNNYLLYKNCTHPNDLSLLCFSRQLTENSIIIFIHFWAFVGLSLCYCVCLYTLVTVYAGHLYHPLIFWCRFLLLASVAVWLDQYSVRGFCSHIFKKTQKHLIRFAYYLYSCNIMPISNFLIL